jgi:hypothetical protein
VNENGPKFQSLQRRIVEHLTLYRIERQVQGAPKRRMTQAALWPTAPTSP